MYGKVLLVVVVAFAWYIQDPIPDNFSEPWKLRAEMAINNMMLASLKIIDKLGVYPFELALRRMAELMYDASGRKSHKLLITNDIMDDVDVRIYKPKGTSSDPEGYPGLVYFHGGGWYMGTLDMYHSFAIAIAEQFAVVIVLVDYRLAPEHIFPEPLNDCVEVTKYLLAHGHSFGVNNDRISIGGDSAGGNLAAAVALTLRDEKFAPMPKLQMLVYPVLQAMDFTLPSYVQNGRGPLIKTFAMSEAISVYAVGTKEYATAIHEQAHTSSEIKKKVYDVYIRHDDIPFEYKTGSYQKPNLDFGDENVWQQLGDILQNPYFSPLMASDLTGLPDTYIYTAQHDVLRDEGLLYGKRLADAGANVRLFHGSSAIHGACIFPHYKEGQECVTAFVNYLEDNL